MNIRDRQILQIALPSIVSNITVPLLGLVDVAIVGHMGSAVYIGAVAVGSMIFNLIYWLFGFLRMGTSGMTSQALGRRDFTEVASLLARSLSMALGIALLFIVFQGPMKWAAFALIGPTSDVAPYASTYFDIVIWGAPASLGLSGLMGWYIGLQNTRIPMVISIGQNIVNILASLALVYGFGMKIEGVALGTTTDILEYPAVLPCQSRHLPPYALSGGSKSLLHFGRSASGGGHPFRQHGDDAALSLLLLFHGWFCLCRRGTGRQGIRG